MNFNKREIKRLKQALYAAINNEAALIDAHRTKLIKHKGTIIPCFPKEHRPQVAQFKRNINAWKKLLCKL